MTERTIAELCDLTEDDPWQTVTPEEVQQQLADYEQNKKLAEIIRSAIETDFSDPADDEDLSIDTDMTLLWRVGVANRRLQDLVNLEPTLPKISLAMRNNSAGCWVAFTSRRVANRIANLLTGNGMLVDLHGCNNHGDKVDPATMKPVNKIEVTSWRPWKQSGPQEDDIRPEEFFYCLSEHGTTVVAHFVPEIYWNEHQAMFDGDLQIDALLGSSFEKSSSCYIGKRDILTLKSFLDKQGFRENLLVQAHVNGL